MHEKVTTLLFSESHISNTKLNLIILQIFWPCQINFPPTIFGFHSDNTQFLAMLTNEHTRLFHHKIKVCTFILFSENCFTAANIWLCWPFIGCAFRKIMTLCLNNTEAHQMKVTNLKTVSSAQLHFWNTESIFRGKLNLIFTKHVGKNNTY